ncbi:MAG TPA: GntR family transcriptional regulator [Rhizobiaceae bacterium]|nr:GntR family transcriptional regulator [Rhizobiaceae bacterium]
MNGSKDRMPGSDAADTLAEAAYARISEMILNLELKPGALISETVLSNHLGIGRTPVRESLKRLKRDRLVHIMPRRGIVVAEIDIPEQLLALEVRRHVERILVTRAARRSTSLQRVEFGRLADRMQQFANLGDPPGYLAVDKEYDDLIDRCAGNPYATDALRPIHAVVRRFWATMKGTEEWNEVSAMHIQVVRAVATGDPEKAEAASAALMDYNEKIFRALTG